MTDEQTQELREQFAEYLWIRDGKETSWEKAYSIDSDLLYETHKYLSETDVLLSFILKVVEGIENPYKRYKDYNDTEKGRFEGFNEVIEAVKKLLGGK